MQITYLATFATEAEAIAESRKLICKSIIQEQATGWLVFQVIFND